VIRTCDNGHPPARVLSGAPCRACERRRPSREARGYDAAHQQARRVLLTTLPTPCAYGCGTLLRTAEEMVAAHVVDGDPSMGWVASCRSCNERAKRDRWGRPSGGARGATTRARHLAPFPGFRPVPPAPPTGAQGASSAATGPPAGTGATGPEPAA
jgi:hypothetical protein